MSTAWSGDVMPRTDMKPGERFRRLYPETPREPGVRAWLAAVVTSLLVGAVAVLAAVAVLLVVAYLIYGPGRYSALLETLRW